MATIRTIADEVAVALGFTHDDARLSFMALAYHVKLAVDKLRGRALAKDMVGDQRRAEDMLEVFAVDVVANTANDTVAWNCLYFDLPSSLS